MGKFNERLESALKQDRRFVSDEGDLLKNEIITAAYKIDDSLIVMLLSDDTFKNKFFKKITGSHVFDIPLFVDYVQDKNFLIDSYTKFKNKIGLTIDGKSLKERGEVALVWPFKDCILEGGMGNEQIEKKEIFFNEILAHDEITRLLDSKVLTNGKKYDAKGEKSFDKFNRNENGTITDNLIVKGNNLLALHSLYREFVGKVKLIYMDPPYNTGSDGDAFKYNNNFKHSTWLTFIKNRLEVSKKLLREDGFIAMTIDHVELFYIGALADEVFGRDNRVGLVTIEHNPKGRFQAKFFSHNTEFMIVYAKNSDLASFNRTAISEEKKQEFKETDEFGKFRWDEFIRARTETLRKNKPDHFYPIYVSPDLQDIRLKPKDGYTPIEPKENGKEYTWKIVKDTCEEKLYNNEIFAFKEKDGQVKIFNKYYEKEIFKNLWIGKSYQSEFGQGNNLIKKLIGAGKFSYPKSLAAVKNAIRIMASTNDIVLDFYAGSGTTGHAVLDMNKENENTNLQFILVEQMNYIDNVTKARIQKVIEENKKGEFIYFELKEYNQEFVSRIQAAKNSKELSQIWKAMKEKSFLDYNIDFREADLAFEEWKKLEFEKQQRSLIELLDKNHLYVNRSEMDDSDFVCTDEEKRLTNEFYEVK